MARQKGIIPIQGTIGNITFYKSKDGHLAREKGGVDGTRIASDPAFQRTRENGAEFGRAGKAGKIVRTALRSLLQNIADARMVSRMTKEMMKVIKSDTTNERGMRTVTQGNLRLLEGFEFNNNSQLSTVLFAAFSKAVNRATGELSIAVPSFVPSVSISAPSGTTHFKLTSAGVAFDFVNGTYEADQQVTAELPWDSNATAAISLVNQISANSTLPLAIVFGIEFYQEVNGIHYPLKNGAFNALAVVLVDVV